MTYRLFFLVTLVGACTSSPSPTPDAGSDAMPDDATIDVTTDDDGGTDSMMTCMGCTLDGSCEPGTAEAACGSGGSACIVCAAGELCIDATCVVPSDCESTCRGCCDGDTCMDGNDVTSCGSAGLTCRACAAGETCEDGACVPPCEATCTGCCTAEGECRVGDDDAACGVAGAACTDCGDGTCDAGMCVAASCAETCDGCCSGDTCLAGDSSSACGTAGGACVDCGPSFTCGSAMCMVDGASRWDVLIEQGMVPTRDWEDRAWDLFGGLPDVYVRLTANDGADELRETSSTIDNDESPAWMDEVVLDAAPARALTAGVFVEIIDRDTAFDQTISSCMWTPSDSDFVIGVVNVTCPARDEDHPDGPAVAASVVLRLERD